jgi:hypothetical protein
MQKAWQKRNKRVSELAVERWYPLEGQQLERCQVWKPYNLY